MVLEFILSFYGRWRSLKSNEVKTMKSDNQIKSLQEWQMGFYKNKDEYFLFGLKEIEKHIPELRELHAAKNPHLYDEIADVYIWSKMLLLANKVDEEIVLKRIKRFREKISAAHLKK